MGYYYNLWVATDDLSGYLEALDSMEEQLIERGFDITMQVFVGDTGKTAGKVMISLGSTDAGVIGAAMDARAEPWFGRIIGGLQFQARVSTSGSLWFAVLSTKNHSWAWIIWCKKSARINHFLPGR